jgi:hypothetical protein
MTTRLFEQLIARIRGEYLEMPGLRLTCDQARRLWGVDRETCVLVLDAMVQSGFLVLGTDARYRRVVEGPSLRLQPAKAALRPPVRAERSG